MKTKTPPADYSGRTFKRLFYETVHRCDLSVEQIAERIGKSPSYLYRSTLPDGGETDSGIPVSVEAWDMTLHVTGDLRSLDYLEAGHGRVAIALPKVPDLPTSELARSLLGVVKEFGDVARSAATALGDDRITKKEAEGLEREGLEAIRALVLLMRQAKGAAK